MGSVLPTNRYICTNDKSVIVSTMSTSSLPPGIFNIPRAPYPGIDQVNPLVVPLSVDVLDEDVLGPNFVGPRLPRAVVEGRAAVGLMDRGRFGGGVPGESSIGSGCPGSSVDSTDPCSSPDVGSVLISTVGFVTKFWRWFCRNQKPSIEAIARDVVSLTDLDPEYLTTIVDDDGERHPLEDDPTMSVMVPDVTAKKVGSATVTRKQLVRRSLARNFVAKWVSWGKAEFPGAYRSSAVADRVCIESRLCRKMREQFVRDCDIARYKGRIMVGIFVPSDAELEEQRLFASVTVGDRCRSALDPGRTWYGWWTGRTGKTWTR